MPRAPTHRGELKQRAAGIEPQVLARPRPPAPATAATGLPPADSTEAPSTPDPSWPPPPASWEPAPGWAPPPAQPAAPAPATTPSPAWPPPQSTTWVRTPAMWRNRVLPPMRVGDPTGVVPSYFWQSVVCLFLFPPMGIVAIVYSILVTRRTQAGNRAAAVRASQLARTWCLATLVVFTAVFVISALAGLTT